MKQVLGIKNENARMKVTPPLAVAPLAHGDDMRCKKYLASVKHSQCYCPVPSDRGGYLENFALLGLAGVSE